MLQRNRLTSTDTPPTWKTSPFLIHHISSSSQTGVGLTQCFQIPHKVLPIHAGDPAAYFPIGICRAGLGRMSAVVPEASQTWCANSLYLHFLLNPSPGLILVIVSRETQTYQHEQSHSSCTNVSVSYEDGAQHKEIRVNGWTVGRDGNLLSSQNFQNLNNYDDGDNNNKNNNSSNNNNNLEASDIQKGPITSLRKTRYLLHQPETCHSFQPLAAKSCSCPTCISAFLVLFLFETFT